MSELIAVCGIDCQVCPAYEATRDNDEAKRKATAEKWSREFKTEIKPEDIYCLGCLNTEGRLFNYCTVCEIRKCALDKGLANCAGCGEFSCTRLDKFHEMIPEARQRLTRLRAQG